MQKMSAYTSLDAPLLSWSPLEDVIWSEVGGDDLIVPQFQDLTEVAWRSDDEHCNKLDHENAQSEIEFLDKSSQKLSIKGLQEDPCTDLTVGIVDISIRRTGSGLTSSRGEAWNELMIASYPSASDCGSSHSTNSSVSFNLRLNGEDRDDGEGNKRAKLGQTDYEHGVQGLCEGHSIYEGNNIEMVNDSCHFSIYDISATEADLDLFEGELGYPKGVNLLEYALGTSGNVEDMDRLLLNNGNLFPETLNDSAEGILWPSPSPGPGISPSHMNFEHANPESRALSGSSAGSKIKMEFISCDDFSPVPLMVTMDWDSELRDSDELVSLSAESGLEQSLEMLIAPENLKEKKLHANQSGSKSTEDDAAQSYLNVDKTHKACCLAASNGQFEGKSKSQVVERSRAPGLQNSAQVCQSQFPYMAVRMQSSPPSHLQVFPSPTLLAPQGSLDTGAGSQSSQQSLQPFPYGCMGNVQNMPTVTSNCCATSYQLQQPHHNYQQPSEFLLQQHQDIHSYDMPPQSFGCSSHMTPQEKVEKLHWRQKMRAKLALEHQHQQLGTQHIPANQKILNQAPKDLQDILTLPGQRSHTSTLESQISSEGSASKNGLPAEDEDETLAAVVLQQLQNNMSKLDTRTRLCIRDALYRLARSAMQRHTLDESRGSSVNSTEPHDGAYGPESSSSDEPVSSNRSSLAVNVVETETNPIDRSIANLLFQKWQPSLPASSMSIPPLSLTNGIPSSQDVLVSSNSWMWQRASSPQANWVVVPSPAETVLTAESNSDFAPVNNVQGLADTSKVVFDHDASTVTPFMLGSKTFGLPSTPVTNFLPGLPSVQSMIRSPSNSLADVRTVMGENCGALPSQASYRNSATSAKHGKAEHAHIKSQLSGASDGLTKTVKGSNEYLLNAIEQKSPELMEENVTLLEDATGKDVRV